MIRKTALVLGIPSGLVILGGLIVLILIDVQMVNAVDSYSGGYPNTQWGLIGLGYIIPGFFGLLSALIQNKGLYIASLAITTISLLIMVVVIFIYLILLSLRFLDSRDHCSSPLGVAVDFFLVFTWVSQLVMFIIICYYTCCAKTEDFQGIVIYTNQQPMIVLNSNNLSASAQTP